MSEDIRFDVKKLRSLLMVHREELVEWAETGKDARRPVELDQARVGRLSRMDALQGQQMAQEAARRRRLQLVRIAGALRRMESGEYGYCAVCGEAIDLRRLAFDPTITRCVACADA